MAGEVKALANQTARATEDIGRQIDQVQGATREAVGAIESIGDVSRAAAEISSAVGQQQLATAEIARNSEFAARGTRDVMDNIASLHQAVVYSGNAAMQVLNESNELAAQSQLLNSEVDGFISCIHAA